MFTGAQLGDALRSAMEKKGISKAEIADHFGLKRESIYDWLKFGRIAKEHIEGVVLYFADVVPESHWGFEHLRLASQPARLDTTIVKDAIEATALSADDADIVQNFIKAYEHLVKVRTKGRASVTALSTRGKKHGTERFGTGGTEATPGRKVGKGKK